MEINEVTDKGSALDWFKERVRESWDSEQIEELMELTPDFPEDARLIIKKTLERIKSLEAEHKFQKKPIKCEDCGYRAALRMGSEEKPGMWFPGMPCPKCSSKQFLPDVEIGRKRRFSLNVYWKRNPLVAGGLIAFLVISLFPLGRTITPRRVRKPGPAVYMCRETGKLFLADIPLYPPRCPYCGAHNPPLVVHCNQCGKIYAWEEADWLKNSPACPKCGSSKYNVLAKIPRGYSEKSLTEKK